MEPEAVPRQSPYISVTWLARVMSGRVSCQWQYWFQTHNKLLSRQSPTFDSVAWQVGHTRLLTEVKQEILRDGTRPHTEVELKFHVPDCEALVAGKVDCLLIGANDLMVYDCKTGKPHDSDRLQVMVYMYGLATYPRYAGLTIRGTVVYRDERVEIPYLPEHFASDLSFFVKLLAGSEPPSREPGHDCAYCRVTSIDCPERPDLG